MFTFLLHLQGMRTQRLIITILRNFYGAFAGSGYSSAGPAGLGDE